MNVEELAANVVENAGACRDSVRAACRWSSDFREGLVSEAAARLWLGLLLEANSR